MYSKDRFSQSDAQFKGADGRVRTATVYTYESHAKIYDVLLIEGMKFVRTNCGSISNMIDKWTPAHYAIESHFRLVHAGHNPSFHT